MKKRFLWRVIQISSKMYAMLVITFTFIAMAEECMIMPLQLIKFLGMSIAIGVITALRMEFDECQWMMRLSFVIKRMLFALIYYFITFVTLLNLGHPLEEGKEDIWVITGGFAAGLLVSGIFMHVREKKKEKDFNLALETFQGEKE